MIAGLSQFAPLHGAEFHLRPPGTSVYGYASVLCELARVRESRQQKVEVDQSCPGPPGREYALDHVIPGEARPPEPSAERVLRPDIVARKDLEPPETAEKDVFEPEPLERVDA